MIRFEVPYAAKRSELTPAIPRRGLNIPDIRTFLAQKRLRETKKPLYRAKKPSLRNVWARMSMGPFLEIIYLSSRTIIEGMDSRTCPLWQRIENFSVFSKQRESTDWVLSVRES